MDGESLNNLLSTMQTADGVFAVSPDQRIVYWGPTAQKILGHEPDEVLAARCQDVIGGKDARNQNFCRQNCPIMKNARKGRPTPDYDILVRSQDGETKWINVSLLLLPDEEHHGVSVVHVFRDVTRRRRLEEKARRAAASLRTSQAQEGGSPSGPKPREPAPSRLTRREMEALRLLTTGLNTEGIAESLGVTPITARNHISSLVTKLGAHTRVQALLNASKLKLI